MSAVVIGMGWWAPATAGAQEDEEAIRVVASGLHDPIGIGAHYENLFVAESGSGDVLRVHPETGAVDVVFGGLVGPSGVARTPHGLAVATSGDYRKYFMQDATRRPHTIDPRSGMPIDNGVASVTVVHERAMAADAWSTALTVLGPEQGLALAERKRLAARFLLREGQGLREIQSSRFQKMRASRCSELHDVVTSVAANDGSTMSWSVPIPRISSEPCARPPPKFSVPALPN